MATDCDMRKEMHQTCSINFQNKRKFHLIKYVGKTISNISYREPVHYTSKSPKKRSTRSV